jgi:hypothetical protein
MHDDVRRGFCKVLFAERTPKPEPGLGHFRFMAGYLSLSRHGESVFF